jgi:Domain of unknown function (DUF6285)
MQDRPTVAELLDAVRGFLEHDAIDALEGTAKFHARVAANVMAIALRELELEPAQLAAEWQRLDALLGGAPAPSDPSALRDAVRARTEALCERIRRGDADDGAFRAAVFNHVRATVREKLAIANPKLLASEDAARLGEPVSR